MFFGVPDDEDDDDFTPSSSASSKLSALFGGNPSGKSSSLKYVAPKQPRPDHADSTGRGGSGSQTSGEQATGGNKQASAVLAAVPVHAFLYVNQSGQAQGRAMCCILGDPNEANFQLLVYRSKQDHLTHARITQHFFMTVQASYYASFTDDQQRNWSILLESSNYIDFLTQIGICRAVVSGGCSSGVVATQDVGVGEGPTLKEGDQAQLSITTWQVTTDGKKGEEVEGRKIDQRVKLQDLDGSWKAGLVGAQKNTHRLIFTRASKTGGSGLVAHEVTVSRVRRKGGNNGGDEVSGRNTPHVQLTPPLVQEKVVVSSDIPVTESTESQSEAEAGVGTRSRPVSSSRAHLVSRVAKVGHQLFPVNPASHIQPTDSESEVEEITCRRSRGQSLSGGAAEELLATPAVSRPASSCPAPSPRPHPATQPQQMVVYQPAFRPHPAAVAGGYAPAVMAPQPAAPPAPDPTLNLLFSETRTQNTELKISVARMSDKIDTLVTKIEKLEQQQQQQVSVAGQAGMGIGGMGGMMMMPQYPVPTPALPTAVQVDLQVLLAQVTNVVQENETMRAKLEEREARVAALNEFTTQLLQKNQKLLEEKTSMLEAQGVGGGMGSEVAALKEEKAKLSGQLSHTSHQLDTLREELSQSKGRLHVKEKEAEELRKQVTAHETSSQENHTAKEALLNQINQLQERLDKARNESKMARKERDDAVREREEAKSECEVAQRDKENARSENEEVRRECEVVKREKEAAIREVTEARKQVEAVDTLGLEAKELENQELKRLMMEKEHEAEELRHQLKEAKEKQGEGAAHNSVVKQQQEATVDQQLQSLLMEKRQLEERIRELEAVIRVGSSINKNNEDTVAVVKHIMNHVYRTIKPQFIPTQAYQGDVVLQNLLTVIRNTTLSMMEELETSTTDGKKSTDVADDERQVNGEEEGSRGKRGNLGNQNNTKKSGEDSGETTVPNRKEVSQQESKLSEVSLSFPDMAKSQNANSPPRVATPDQNLVINTISYDNYDSGVGNTDSPCVIPETSSPEIGVEEMEQVPSVENTEAESVEHEAIKAAKSNADTTSVECSTGGKGVVKSSDGDGMQTEPYIDSVDTKTGIHAKLDGSRDSSLERRWRPQPPTPPLFSDEDDDDSDWLS